MSWTIYGREIYEAAFSRLVNLHQSDKHETYIGFGRALPPVMTRYKKNHPLGRTPSLNHISPRYVGAVLAPIHWACDLADAPSISALVVRVADLQPGESCNGTVEEVRSYKYDYKAVKKYLDLIISNPTLMKTLFRFGKKDRTERKAQIERLLCQI